ncbi:folylpolyglutamate synthase [Colletotrichum tofieldiae]|uniref:tetrahydrofolate synthase n=1 Tax=Colletotrichum tofieldiae TaxID=708197 RepID=A0A166V979_9PEZI|nr:folylpolyglutamate synthase [Colletotrichum tofieldiae]GKT64412.1 folylpolyglutamate synthase [Colletotrichum tofieldiae]GKT74385.1 folylpolyglutamate synthase [Colletotrichum tofieldiae]
MSSPSTTRTYTDALNLLNTLIPNLKVHALFGKPQDTKPQNAAPKPPASDPNRLALPEMRAWLLRASLAPQRLSSLSYIHIAGTKGKGSVTTLTTSALLASPPSGRVGTYTSPHLVTPRERIAVDGRPVSQDLFAASFFELWDLLSAAPADEALGIEAGSKPFYFRFLTLLALHIFLKQKVRSVVMECGIGGEYDATNAIPPAAVTTGVITQLGIDHVAMLGDTAEKIAWHKAGIMKPGVTTFTRRLDGQPGVMEVLRTRAREIGADLVEVADEEVTAWGGVPGAKLPGGDFQKRNQALAALAARRHVQVLEGRETETKEHRLRDVSETIIAGLREATLRGRHEVMERDNVSWHLDGAHNTDSLAEVARWMAPVVADSGTKFVLVFNQQERDASELLLGLLKEMDAAGVDLESRLDSVIFTRNDKTKIAEDVDVAVQEKCAAAFKEAYPAAHALVCKDLTEMKSAVDAIAAAQNTTRPGARVLVTGSMYLVGNVIGLLEPEGLL